MVRLGATPLPFPEAYHCSSYHDTLSDSSPPTPQDTSFQSQDTANLTLSEESETLSPIRNCALIPKSQPAYPPIPFLSNTHPQEGTIPDLWINIRLQQLNRNRAHTPAFGDDLVLAPTDHSQAMELVENANGQVHEAIRSNHRVDLRNAYVQVEYSNPRQQQPSNDQLCTPSHADDNAMIQAALDDLYKIGAVEDGDALVGDKHPSPRSELEQFLLRPTDEQVARFRPTQTEVSDLFQEIRMELGLDPDDQDTQSHEDDPHDESSSHNQDLINSDNFFLDDWDSSEFPNSDSSYSSYESEEETLSTCDSSYSDSSSEGSWSWQPGLPLDGQSHVMHSNNLDHITAGLSTLTIEDSTIPHPTITGNSHERVHHDKHYFHFPKMPDNWRLSLPEREIYLASLIEGLQSVHEAAHPNNPGQDGLPKMPVNEEFDNMLFEELFFYDDPDGPSTHQHEHESRQTPGSPIIPDNCTSRPGDQQPSDPCDDAKAYHIRRTQGMDAFMTYLYECEGMDGPPKKPVNDKFDNMLFEELDSHTISHDDANSLGNQNSYEPPQKCFVLATRPKHPAVFANKPSHDFDVIFEDPEEESFTNLPGNVFLTKATKLLARSLMGQGLVSNHSATTKASKIAALWTQITNRGGTFYSVDSYGPPVELRALSFQDARDFLTLRWQLECESRRSLLHPENLCIIEEICKDLQDKIDDLADDTEPSSHVQLAICLQNTKHRLQQLFGISTLLVPDAEVEAKLLPTFPNATAEHPSPPNIICCHKHSDKEPPLTPILPRDLNREEYRLPPRPSNSRPTFATPDHQLHVHYNQAINYSIHYRNEVMPNRDIIRGKPMPDPNWPFYWSKNTAYSIFDPPAVHRFRAMLHKPNIRGYQALFQSAQEDSNNPLLYDEASTKDYPYTKRGLPPSGLTPTKNKKKQPPSIEDDALWYGADNKKGPPSIEDDALWFGADNKKGPPPPSASPVLVANAPFKTPLLPCVEKMPHVNFPIGAKPLDATLCAMLDTGAGCNLGREDYHIAIAERCPDLVVAIESKANNNEWNNIHVGSIEEQGTPIVITSVIVYKTPYTTDGHPVQLRIGLAKNAAINTILGIPFFQATQSVMHFRATAHDLHQLVCPRIGTNLPILMQAPTCSNAPDSIDKPDRRSLLTYRASPQANVSNSTDKPDRRSLLTYMASPEVKKAYMISADAEELLAPNMKCQPPKDGDEFLMIDHEN